MAVATDGANSPGERGTSARAAGLPRPLRVGDNRQFRTFMRVVPVFAAAVKRQPNAALHRAAQNDLGTGVEANA